MKSTLCMAVTPSLRLLGALSLVMSVMTLGVMLPADIQAQSFQVECAGTSSRVKAVRLQGSRDATIDFGGWVNNYPPGSFDPVPLLRTTIAVTQPTCLVAHFSAMVQPADNHIVFQARVNGMPMQGHEPDLLGIRVPTVSDPNQTDVFYDVPRMVAYNFFQQVGPGVHTVDILFAGCCNANFEGAQGLVNAAVLTLEY